MYLLQGCCVAGGVSPPSWGYRIWDKRVTRQVTGVEVGFDGLETRHVYRDDSGSVSGARELKLFFEQIFCCFLQLNKVSGRR
jgi:hypothetical protein